MCLVSHLSGPGFSVQFCPIWLYWSKRAFLNLFFSSCESMQISLQSLCLYVIFWQYKLVELLRVLTVSHFLDLSLLLSWNCLLPLANPVQAPKGWFDPFAIAMLRQLVHHERQPSPKLPYSSRQPHFLKDWPTFFAPQCAAFCRFKHIVFIWHMIIVLHMTAVSSTILVIFVCKCIFRRAFFFLLQDEWDEACTWLLSSTLWKVSLKDNYPGTTSLQYRPVSNY